MLVLVFFSYVLFSFTFLQPRFIYKLIRFISLNITSYVFLLCLQSSCHLQFLYNIPSFWYSIMSLSMSAAIGHLECLIVYPKHNDDYQDPRPPAMSVLLMQVTEVTWSCHGLPFSISVVHFFTKFLSACFLFLLFFLFCFLIFCFFPEEGAGCNLLHGWIFLSFFP